MKDPDPHFEKPEEQQGLTDGTAPPAHDWSADVAQHALDDLFSAARRYRTTKAFKELIQFCSRFRFYSPFNAMLVHIQMEGASFVAPAHRWWDTYKRRIRPEARPLVILQPMGPVMFVFDVSETEPTEGAPALPPEVEQPFEVRRGHLGDELERTIENAKRDGIRVVSREAGSQSAGLIRSVPAGERLRVLVKQRPQPTYVEVPVRYDVLLNKGHSKETAYATLVHELAHLYCGHLGTPDARWWPDRRNIASDVAELEAEAVSYLLCARLGLDTPSDRYLFTYLSQNAEMPETMSLDRVVKSAGLIEQMARERLPFRKSKG